jgi:hypothetical protein
MASYHTAPPKMEIRSSFHLLEMMQGSSEHLQEHNSTGSNTKEAHSSTVLSSSSTGEDSRLSGRSGAVVLGASDHTASSGSSRDLGRNSARAIGDGDSGGRRDGVDIGVDGGGVRSSSSGRADSSDAIWQFSLVFSPHILGGMVRRENLRRNNLSSVNRITGSRRRGGSGVRNQARDDAAGGSNGILAKTSSIVGSALSLVGRKTVRTTSGSAGVVSSVASALASCVVGRALGLVGGKAISAASSAAGVVLVNTAAGGGSTGSGRGGRGSSRSGGSVRDEAGDDTARGSDGVFAEASGVLANASGLVGRKAISSRSSLASDQGSVAVALALSVLSRALGLVGRKTSNGVAGTASIVLGNTASSCSGGVLGSDSTNKGERGNSSELHVCGSV